MRAIRDRLREMYGRPVNEPHGEPIAELIKTVLSQHTNDRNRDRAFAALRERFPSWEEVRDAPLAEIEEAIRPGGLGSAEGAPHPGDPRRAWASRPTSTGPRRRPAEESLDFLLELPGVGRKTAACVLIFSWGIPEIPVDVHIHRVGGRLGLFPQGASFEAAHDEMLAIVEPEDAYELHMNLIRHGRERLPSQTPMRGVRAATDVPLVPCPAQMSAERGGKPMRKKTFVIFGLLVIVSVVLIPWLVFRSNGDAARGAQQVPANLKEGQSLFQTNCGTCHTLYAAGTDGNYAPNLDELLAPNGPPSGPTAKQSDERDRKTGPQRPQNGRRQHDHPGPHAGRDPQRRPGQRSRRIRRPHRRRGLDPPTQGRVRRWRSASTVQRAEQARRDRSPRTR